MTAIITVGNTQADSADFTLSDGASTTITLFPADSTPLPSNGRAVISIKVGTQYIPIGELATEVLELRARVIAAPGTYRVRRLAGVNFGVDRV